MNFNQIGIDIGNKTSGQVKVKCPRCSHSRKNKMEPCLSVNIDDGAWNCHNCEWKGTLKGLEWADSPKKEEVNIKYNNTDLPDNVVEWFGGRGISKSTLQRFDIGFNNGWIQFPFWYNGKVVNIKSRTIDKKFKLESGGMTIPFNFDTIKGVSKVLITEGEIDALSSYEAFPNMPVISLPNGVKSLDWLNKFWSQMDKVDHFIIAVDGDEVGKECLAELSNRLGKHRCSYIEYPEGCKDLNDVLVSYDTDLVKNLIDNPATFPVDGLVEFADYAADVLKYWEHGFPKGSTVGPVDLREIIAFQLGQVTTITGTPGSGKSEFVDQLMIWLNQVYGWKFGVCSFENQPVGFHVSKLVSKLSEKALNQISPEELGLVMDQIKDNFFFYDLRGNNLTIDGILDKARELVGRHGIKSLLIDPYNYIEHKIPNGSSETNYISEVLTKVVSFAKSHQVHVFFVAHPRKMRKLEDGTGNYEVPNLYDISGSAHWFNKTDNGITVWRDFNSNNVRIYTTKVRFDWNGKVGSCDLQYDKQKKIYSESLDMPF